MEEVVQTGVEVAAEAAQPAETPAVPTETGEQQTGEQGGSEAGTKGDPDTAWEKRISSMRQKWEQETAQKYGDYDQLKSAAEQAKHLERVAKFYGFEKPDEYLAALDQAEQDALIQEQASKLGVPEEFIRGELQPLKSELEALKQERAQLQQRENERQISSEVERVKAANPDFDQYFDAIVPLFQKGYSIEDAYRLASYEDKLSKISQEKEQEVLARVTGRDDKQVLSSGDKPNNLSFNPANMSEKEIMDISARVQRGEKITFK